MKVIQSFDYLTKNVPNEGYPVVWLFDYVPNEGYPVFWLFD